MENEKVRFTYLRDGLKRPVITIATLDCGDFEAVGLAICSFQDNPCKKDGRGRALGRAKKAAKAKKGVLPVRRAEAVIVLIDVLDNDKRGPDFLRDSVFTEEKKFFKGFIREKKGGSDKKNIDMAVS